MIKILSRYFFYLLLRKISLFSSSVVAFYFLIGSPFIIKYEFRAIPPPEKKKEKHLEREDFRLLMQHRAQNRDVAIYKETHRERALSHEASKSGFKFNSVRCNALWPCSFESGWNDSFDGISQSREKIDRWKRWESSISRLAISTSRETDSRFVSLRIPISSGFGKNLSRVVDETLSEAF